MSDEQPELITKESAAVLVQALLENYPDMAALLGRVVRGEIKPPRP